MSSPIPRWVSRLTGHIEEQAGKRQFLNALVACNELERKLLAAFNDVLKGRYDPDDPGCTWPGHIGGDEGRHCPACGPEGPMYADGPPPSPQAPTDKGCTRCASCGWLVDRWGDGHRIDCTFLSRRRVAGTVKNVEVDWERLNDAVADMKERHAVPNRVTGEGTKPAAEEPEPDSLVREITVMVVHSNPEAVAESTGTIRSVENAADTAAKEVRQRVLRIGEEYGRRGCSLVVGDKDKIPVGS